VPAASDLANYADVPTGEPRAALRRDGFTVPDFPELDEQQEPAPAEADEIIDEQDIPEEEER
jgi:hypothetical protein